MCFNLCIYRCLCFLSDYASPNCAHELTVFIILQKLQLKDVMSIEKNKQFGLFDTGLLIKERINDVDESIARYQFSGFKDRN